ncbi:MAG: TetR/AcrR family transcriptional regulator [Lachnospiraceae bacterium]
MPEIKNITKCKEYRPKVKAMFEAVLELFASGCDLSTMKVAEITSKAGIGKGTAYEYFSTKEEIVLGALNYEFKRNMKQMMALLKSGKNFKEVIYEGMELMEQGNNRYHGFAIMQKIMEDKGISGKTMLYEIEKHQDACDLMLEFTEEFSRLALKDDCIKETEHYKIQTAIISQCISFAFYLTHRKLYPEVEIQTAKDFAYESILKMLN